MQFFFLSSIYKKLLSKILFLQDFPNLIGSAFAFVPKLNGIFSQIDFGYFPVCKKESGVLLPRKGCPPFDFG